MKQMKDWDLGLELLKKIEGKNAIDLDKDSSNDDMEAIEYSNDVPDFIPVSLEKPDWLMLIKSLLKEYKRLVVNTCEDDDNKKPNRNSIKQLTNTTFINQSIQVLVEMEEGEVEKPAEPLDGEKNDVVVENTMEKMLDEPMEIAVLPPATEDNTIPEAVPAKNISDIPVLIEKTPIVAEDNNDVNMTEAEHQSSLKRKREEDDEQEETEPNKEVNGDNNSEKSGDSENDEEDEAEEKRLSLRLVTSLVLILCFDYINPDFNNLEHLNDNEKKLQMRKLHGSKCSKKKSNLLKKCKLFMTRLIIYPSFIVQLHGTPKKLVKITLY